MPQKENRRTAMTKKLLQNSLIDILEKKPIHEITIKEICQNADVNRSTFYRHYNTPRELFDEIYNAVYNDILAIVSKIEGPALSSPDVLAGILSYCEKNRRLVLVLLSKNGELNIGQSFSDLVTQAVLHTPHNYPSELHMYIVQFMAAGMANFIWTWLNTEDRLSAHTVARGMMMLINHGMNRATRLTPDPERQVPSSH
ncbi:MAG: TetR/AcrR family transcriptional regulator [Clostridia bacterium]|nr:TetR/AcrR family transcriptional regulator [Clostridia bacterium]